MKNFIIYYSIIVFVFIILLHLNSYDVLFYIVTLFILQLFLDNFIYKNNLEKKIYFVLRLPLTSLIVFSIIVIQL